MGEALLDFVGGVHKAIIRMMADAAAQKIIGGLLGGPLNAPGAEGTGGLTGIFKGIAGMIAGAEGFAKGGIVRSPTLALAGEAGAEAFVPLEGGAIPVKMQGGGGSTVNLNVSAMDGASVAAFFQNNKKQIANTLQSAMGDNHPMRRNQG